MRNERYHTLDGLRGVGALWVVFLHFAPTFGVKAPAHGYLAVDLFFCLSGFVLSRAYIPKLRGGMTFKSWIEVRLIRLYPLFILSIVLSFVLTFLVAIPGSELTFGARMAALTTSALMLPSPTWQIMPEMFPLNFVAWSLFVEMVLSIAFFWMHRWSNRSIWLVLAMALVGLLAVRLTSGYIGGGFAWRDMPAGFVRGFYAFSAGMLIARYVGERRTVTQLAWLPLAAAALILSVNPPHGTAYDLLVIMAVLPALVLVASKIEPPQTLIPTLGGDVSYAVYVMHGLVFFTIERLTGASSAHPYPPLVGCAALAAFIYGCWWLDRHFDRPLGRMLNASFHPKQPPRTLTVA